MPLAALRDILAAAGVEASELPYIAGADPVVRTRYRVGTAGAAALAALGLAAGRFGGLRGLARPRGAGDVRAAGGLARSPRYLRVGGRPPPPQWDPLSGFYPVHDGW